MNNRPGIALPVLIAALLLVAGSAWSTTTDADEKIIFIGILNFDCYPDTVRGEKSGNDGYLPGNIRWGRSRGLDDSCSGKTPPRKQVKETRFIYPAWKITGASVAFQSINGDSLADIIIHIKGKIPGEENEMLRSVVLFGQHSIDTVPVIHIGQIGRFQTEPFFAMDLVRGSELTRAGTRDLSGTTSYILEPVAIDLSRSDSLPPPPAAPLAGIDRREALVRLYPNPAQNTMGIEAGGLAAGTYILEVISVNGDVVLREEVRISPGEELQKTLDLKHVATGYYVVRIESGEGSIGTWPVIITH